jgi:hypothetical protein
MKNLVLGALLIAAASSTACTSSSSTEAVVTARWSFSSYANRNQVPNDPCPTGFNTASVHAKEWDPVLGEYVAGGLEVVDKFTCSDMRGITDPLDGTFLIWVQIENDSGSNVYAQSESEFFDTADGDKTIDLPTLFVDAGYFDLSWDLISSANARLSCAQAGIGSSGSVATTVVESSSNFMAVDKFTCEDGFGTTAEVPVGLYDVTVTAENGSADIGASLPLANKPITAPNGLTHLGHVRIPVTP